MGLTLVAAPPRSRPLAPALRQLASGVCLVAYGARERAHGFVAASVAQLGADPPTLIVAADRARLAAAPLAPGDGFGVSALGCEHGEIADGFALGGVERFRLGRWVSPRPDVLWLDDSMAAFDCEAEEIIERREQTIVIARVRAASVGDAGGALLRWRGGYDRIGWSGDELARAVGLSPSGAERPRLRAAD